MPYANKLDNKSAGYRQCEPCMITAVNQKYRERVTGSTG